MFSRYCCLCIFSSIDSAILNVQVNEQIILAACTLLDCELIEQKHCAALKKAGEQIKDVSGINTNGWSLLKLATALMIILYPEENILAGNPKMVTFCKLFALSYI